MSNTKHISTIRSIALTFGVALLPAAAHAGPNEVFATIAIHPADSKKIAVGYENGYAGLFVSSDGGHTFRMRPSQSLQGLMENTYFPRDDFPLAFSGSALLIGGTAGLLSGDTETCGLAQTPTLRDDIVRTFAPHPVDPEMVFMVSRKGNAARGGLFRRAKTGELSALGVDDASNVMISSLAVVPRAASSEQLRFVEAGTRLTAGAAVASPFLRYSDDLGVTWTERALALTSPTTVRLLGVDPLDPDRFVVGAGTIDPMPDEVLVSVDAGKNFSVYTTAIRAMRYATFAPDGRFWLGDMLGGLYAAPRLGDPLTKSSELEVYGLAFDKSDNSLLIAQPYEFGRLTPSNNAYCQMFRIYEVDAYPSCPGENIGKDPDTKDQVCQAYCNGTHFWYAPVCAQYEDVAAVCGAAVKQTEYAVQLPNLTMEKPRCAGYPPIYQAPSGMLSDGGIAVDAGSDADLMAGTDAGGAPVDAGMALGADVDTSMPEGDAENGEVVPRAARKGGCSVAGGPGNASGAAAGTLTIFALAVGRFARRVRRRKRDSAVAAWLVALLFTLACAACGSDEPGNGHGGEHAGAQDAGEADAEDTGSSVAPVSCAASIPRVPTDIESAGADKLLRAKVASADYEPARKYTNTWSIDITDEHGNPLADAEISNVRTYMPVHGHDGKITPTVTSAAEQGRFTFANLNFTMTGPWQVQFGVSSTSMGKDRFMLDVCVGD